MCTGFLSIAFMHGQYALPLPALRASYTDNLYRPIRFISGDY